MAQIDLQLAHSYKANPSGPQDYALHRMDMRFEDGGAYALLGPSGCGKSTMLNIISGLVAPSEGKVMFDGKNVSDQTPQERNIAQVFQFPVIYDTMTVADNLAFPLRNRGVDAQYIAKRIAEIAEMLELGTLMKQRASGLSADVKQKISLGRGLVRPDVSAILFDEPLTVIDPHLKWQLRRKLKQIHNELKLTLVYVTHDQVEALTFADQVVVMSQGKAVQVGSPQALFERPAHTFVGHFIGSPGMNFVSASINSANTVEMAGQTLQLPASQVVNATTVTVGIRPEHLQTSSPGKANELQATVSRVQDVGTYYLITCQAGEALLKSRQPKSETPPIVGATVSLNVINSNTCYYVDEELVA
ncbi:ABC transporter ATP-binding protein [Comamonadaceae bacterium M7527]|nr:ABC transporter ATP-binding protein [Comamonadaceae bacterium M7527]